MANRMKIVNNSGKCLMTNGAAGGRGLSNITTIFFDLDNTLIATRKADSKACGKLTDHLRSEHNIPRDQANQITSTFLKSFRCCPDNPEFPLDTWRHHLWMQSLPDIHKHLSHDIYKSWHKLRLRYLALAPEITQMLQSLRSYYILGLITNGPTNAQWEKVQELKLSTLFDCILVSADLPWEKPDERIFLTACNYLGVEPERCIMVGDKLETDIQGGIEAKLGATVWLPLTMEERPEPGIGPFPDYTITNILDLQKLLPESQPPKMKAFRSNSSSGAANGVGSPFNRRIAASLPDLENNNSNGSDGS